MRRFSGRTTAVAAIGAPVVALLCVFYFVRRPAGDNNGNRLVAEIGEYKVHERDVVFRDGVIRVYYPQETRSMGLLQLRRAFSYATILKNNGRPITEAIVQGEQERIDKETLAPVMLQKIRAIFGSDAAAYRKDFVLPMYVERVIYYDFFLNDPRAQSGSIAQARNFLKDAAAEPGRFADLAKAWSKTTTGLTISRDGGLQWDRPKEAETAGAPPTQGVPAGIQQKLAERARERGADDGSKWIDEVISRLKPGQVYGKLIDMGEHWVVARYVGPVKGGAHRIAAVLFPKADFNRWLESEEKKVKVVTY